MTQFLPAGEGSILIFKHTPSPPSSSHPFLVLVLNKSQAWVGPWVSQAGLERSSLVNVTSSIGVSEKSLLGPTDTCSFWHPAWDESWVPQVFYS